jgi:uncharacterized protein YdaL
MVDSLYITYSSIVIVTCIMLLSFVVVWRKLNAQIGKLKVLIRIFEAKIEKLEEKGESEVESISAKIVDRAASQSAINDISKTSLQNKKFEEALTIAEELKATVAVEPKKTTETVILENKQGTKLYKDRFIHEGKSYPISEMKKASVKSGFIHLALLEILFKNGKIREFQVVSASNTTITNISFSDFKIDQLSNNFKVVAQQWASMINKLIGMSSK